MINVYGFRFLKNEIQCYYKFTQDISRSFDGSIDVKGHPSEDYIVIQFKNGATMRIDKELLNGESTENFVRSLDSQLGLV